MRLPRYARNDKHFTLTYILSLQGRGLVGINSPSRKRVIMEGVIMVEGGN